VSGMSPLDLAAVKGLLFADQNLEDLTVVRLVLAQVVAKRAGDQFLNARSLLMQGREQEAISGLKNVCASDNAETRYKLWAWSNLRRFGVSPDDRERLTVRGVVLEVEVTGGLDTLAVYEDGSVRYLNFSGKFAVWDAIDAKITALCNR